MKRSLFFLLIAGLLCSPPAGADEYPRNADVDIVHYRFHLTLNDDSDEIVGRAQVTVRFVAAGVTEFALDLIGSEPGAPTGMDVTGVTRGNDSVGYAHADDRLSISLSSPSSAEDERTYTISYRGVPADGLIIDENMFGDRTFFGDNWPNRARHWLPTVDHVSDKATVEWLITAPEHYQVVGNGRLVERSNIGDGLRLTHWSSIAPMPTKVMVFGAARFAVQNVAVVAGVPVQSWVYPQNRDAGFYDYALAEKVLRFFDSHIGPYSYAKLANVQSKTRYGGMENAGNIFYSERSVSGNRRGEGLIAHEVAHQWFGDSVTEADWHHIWLSEGFATYFTQLYNEFTHGHDVLVRGMENGRDSVIAYYAAHPQQALIAEELTDPNDMLNGNAYQKGGWVLHMLRRQIGDAEFWSGIRSYYREYRNGNALTEDLQRVMEEAAGQDLGWFFAQWAYTPGHPQIDTDWTYNAATKQLQVDLRQVQESGTVFRFPLDIGIVVDSTSPARIETVEVTATTQTFSFDVDEEPTSVVLDPGVWLLFEEAPQGRR